MFTQFKNYIKRAAFPAFYCSGVSAIVGVSAGSIGLSSAAFQDSSVQASNELDLNAKLSVQMISGLSGATIGLIFGVGLPAAGALFNWSCSQGREIYQGFSQQNNMSQDIEIGGISP